MIQQAQKLRTTGINVPENAENMQTAGKKWKMEGSQMMLQRRKDQNQ